jgi:hypothetical protein
LRKALGAVLFLAVAVPRLVLAEAPPADAKPARVKFDPATVVAMSGTVLAETRMTHSKGRTIVRLVLRSGDQQVSVHVGPESWVEKQKWTFAKGDEVTVKGSKFTFDGNVGLIAQSITRGKETLVLRDSSGKPISGGNSQK